MIQKAENNKRPTQCKRLIEYLNTFGSVTQIQALNDLGIMRLASRISELRKQGFNIQDKQVAVKNRFGEKCSIKRYFLGDEKWKD